MLKFFFYRINYVFYFFLITIFAIFLWLTNGIQIDEFEYENIKISNFFLKYDKKLILNIKNIEITPSKSGEKKSNYDLDIGLLNNINRVLANFSHIKIQNIDISKYKIFIEYITQQNYFKIIINDKLFINTRLEIKNNILTYQMKAKLKNDLDFLLDFINIDKKLKDSIGFESISLSQLEGKLDLTKIDKVEPLLLIPTIDIQKPKLAYPNSPIVSFEKVKIFLENGKIVTQLTKTKDKNSLTFDGKIDTNLDFKDIAIDGILDFKNVKIDLKTDINIDKIYKIKAHHINMINTKLYFKGDATLDPKTLKDKDGIKLIVDNFSLIFDENLMPVKAKKVDFLYKNKNIFLKFHKPTFDKLSLDGTFVSIKNILNISKTILKIDLKSKELLQEKLLSLLEHYKVKLPLYQISGDNKIAVDITIPFSKKNKTKFSIITNIKSKNSQIKLNDNILNMANLELTANDTKVDFTCLLDDKNRNLEIKNSIYLKEKISKGTIKINSFLYKDMIKIQDEKFDYVVNFKENISVDIKKYRLNYQKNKNQHTIKIGDFGQLMKFTNIFKNIALKSKTSFVLKSDDDFKTNKINIDNLYIKIDDKYLKKKNKKANKQQKSKTNLPKIDINMRYGRVLYKKYSLFYNNLDIDIQKSTVKLKCVKKKNIISSNIDIDKKTLTIKSDEIRSEFVNNLIGKKLLKDGFITLDTKGTFDKQQGLLVFVQTTIQDVQIINNLILFINTTPAIINPLLALPTLFRLGQNGFDMQGYYTNGGWLEFNYDIKKDFFYFKEFNTNGTMVDFKGKGLINIKTDDIGFNIDVVFLKDYSKFISHIPLLGYIITGDGGNFVTQVDIFGNLKEPKFETHMVKNSVKGVGNIIKRTILSPVKLIQDVFNVKSSTKEQKLQHEKRVKQLLGN